MLKVFRLTPYNETVTLKDVVAYLENYASDVVVGEEMANNRHFHAVFKSTEEDDRNIREKLYDYFNTPDEKVGNTIYSIALAKKEKEAYMYAIKEGNYQVSEQCKDGFSLYIEELYEESYMKPKSYTLGYQQLCKEFQEDEITKRELWVELLRLRGSFNLECHLYKIDGLVLGQMVQKDPNLADILVKDRKTFY